MKKIIGLVVFTTTLIYGLNCKAQTPRTDKLYTMSGIGTSIPLGKTADYLKPKISTTLGINLGLGNGGWFLYPSVSLHVFGYNGITPAEGTTITPQNGRSSTYLLNVAGGYRKMMGKVAIYGFAGGGGGFVLTPKVTLSNTQAVLDNVSNSMATTVIGAGAEWNLGGASLFVESNYMHGFTKIQGRNFDAMPVCFGIKPNLSKLFRKK